VAPLDTAGLPAVSDDAPAGANLELDPEFGALERAAQGRPETQYGNTVEPAVPPDWKETVILAEALMQRTHDLRVMGHLAIARLHLTGLPGFAETMRLVRQQLEMHWDEVHPQLDPEDDLDPMQRSNAVLRLQDPGKVLRAMRDTPLATTPRTGPVSWRDIAVLNGTQEPEPGRERLTEAAVLAAFAGTDPARLQALREAVDSAIEDAASIPGIFDSKSGTGTGPDFADLSKLLRDIQKELKRFEHAAAQGAPADEPAAADAAGGAGPRAEAGAARAAATVQAILTVSKREDALHALELAATYFRTHEPSSPLPLLIDRAKRLATMEFMDILKDLAPDGLTQAQTIAGTTTQ